jgi:nucleoside phosphorylase
MSLFVKLGIQNLVLDSSREGLVNLLAFRNHNNFPEFVRAKDNLLYLMAKEQPKSVSIERYGFLSKVRGLGLNQLSVDALKDPSIAAIAVYRAAEELCRIEPATAKRKNQMPDALSWKGKYLIVTATDIEDQELQAALTTRGFSPPVIENEDRFTFITRFRSDVGRVFHLRTSAGSGGASGATIMGKNAIDVLKPEFVISVGICFGLREKDQQLGDVVVSEMIHDYERERVSETRPEDRGATREAGPILLSRARANSIIWTKAPLHFGTIASGEKLVDDEKLREKLKALQPNPIAGDMEAWGLSAVCHESQKQFIMVKGICDWGFNKKKDHQQLAAKNACDFVLDALVVKLELRH